MNVIAKACHGLAYVEVEINGSYSIRLVPRLTYMPWKPGDIVHNNKAKRKMLVKLADSWEHNLGKLFGD